MKTATSVMAIGLILVSSAAWAASPPASLTMVPPYINYQGRLVTPTNSPYADATHTIDLSLYPTASGGTKVWSERYAVQTKDGYFSVNLSSGGVGLLASNNLPVWQVLWRTDPASPDTYFMALTVRTDQNGNPIANPAEATPRQQFLTAPFTFRSHQSVYATKADGLFDAAQGIQTPVVSGVSNELTLNANVKVAPALTVYANRLVPQGTSGMRVYSGGANMYIGGETAFVPPGIFVVRDQAATIQIGAVGLDGSGTDIRLVGNHLNLGVTNVTMENSPMFVRTTVSVAANTGSTLTSVAHGIDVNHYDVMVVGWYYNLPSPGVRSARIFGGNSVAYMYFTAVPTGGTVTMEFLGIRKGLTEVQ